LKSFLSQSSQTAIFLRSARRFTHDMNFVNSWISASPKIYAPNGALRWYLCD
jgi:hypothetical protein